MISDCDDAEAQLQELNEALAEYGVTMGEILWDGKNPNRKIKGSKELPLGGAQAVRSRGVR